MPKYQLSERQKNILRAASKGLRDGTVKAEWTWFTMQSDTDGLEFEISDGFSAAKELGVGQQDLRDFERLGFLYAIAGRKAYHVNEQVIHDAVDNDFEIPDNAATSTNVQTNIHGDVIGSNINTAQRMENISQKARVSEFLPLDVQDYIQNKITELQQELKAFEETHSREIREVNRTLDIVMEDLADSEPDMPNVTGSLERLKRAGEKLIFAPLAMVLVEQIADKISSIIPSISA